MNPFCLQHYTFGLEEEYLWEAGQGAQTSHPPFEHWENHQEQRGFAIGREAHADVVELISPILSQLSDVARHLRESRAWLHAQAKAKMSSVFAGGTHPTRDWKAEQMTDRPYYAQVVNDYGAAMRGNFIFGMHTHLGGIPKHRIPAAFNEMRPLLPVLIALSGNSSHWRGEDTGLACYRLCTFSRMPRTGIPPKMVSVDAWMRQLDDRLRAGSLKKATQIWYDMRYHPVYHTLENRVMDMQPNTDVAVGIALLSLMMLISVDQNGPLLPGFSSEMPDWAIEENRWRAIRNGRHAHLLNDQLESVPARTLIGAILEKLHSPLYDVDQQAYAALVDFNAGRLSC